MEAVKQGSATVGLKSKTHAVLVALKVCIISDLLFLVSVRGYVDFILVLMMIHEQKQCFMLPSSSCLRLRLMVDPVTYFCHSV